MAHESFESPDVAAILNESFIPIKVDREAQQDVDEIYMEYVTATSGHGGWPLNVFLTPDLEPLFGGTYWPGPNTSSQPRQGSAGEVSLTFLDILKKMREVWRMQRQRCLVSAKEITRQLRSFAEEGTHSKAMASREGSPEPLDIEILDEAFSHFESRYDKLYGGFMTSPTSPKFPTPPNLLLLLRLGGASSSFGFPNPVPSIIGRPSCLKASEMVTHTLLAMSRGGIRDQLGMGISRYSVTRDWKLPHFEKMLTDNAQLLSVYTMAFAKTREPELLGVIYSLIAYLTSSSSPLVASNGALFSSEDADSPPSNSNVKGEGAHYLFWHKRVHSILADMPVPSVSERKQQPQYPTTPPNPADILCRHFGVLPDGNIPTQYDPHDEFLGQNILTIAATPSVLAKEFGLNEEEVVRIIKAGRERLLQWRLKNRPKPDVDTKVVAGWQGLAVTGLLDASSALKDIDTAKSMLCLDSAKRVAEFVRGTMYESSTGKLFRIWTPEQGLDKTIDAFSDDYAYLVRAAIGLYEAGAGEYFLQWADKMQQYLNTHFLSSTSGSGGSGFYTTSTASPFTSHNILRLKSGTDNALPSPNGLIASNLLRLSILLDEPAYATIAAGTIDAFAVEILQHPFLYVSLLDAVVRRELGGESVVVPKGIAPPKGKWGRELLWLGEESGDKWLKERNGTFAAANADTLRESGKVLFCGRDRTCREVTPGELEAMDRAAEESEEL
ncbi:MAG: hypothetical protein Q9227_004549 [Pyrenula ochraceoflavens]